MKQPKPEAIICISNLHPSIRMSRSYLNEHINKLLKVENRVGTSLSLLLVTDSEIKKINRKFRKINKPTDVLSFESGNKLYLGDIVISLDIAKLQARRVKLSLREMVIILFVQGYLHLTGMDHQKQNDYKVMRDKERFLLRKVIGSDLGLIALEGLI